MLAEAWVWLILVSGVLLFGAVEPWSFLVLQFELILFPAVSAFALPRRDDASWSGPLIPSFLFILVLGALQWCSPIATLGPGSLWLSTVDAPRTSAALVTGVCFLAFLVEAPRVLAREGAPHRLAWFMYLLGAAIACVGLLQIAQGNRWIYGLRAVASDRTPFGPYYNRNHASMLMAMALPIGSGLAYGHWIRWYREEEADRRIELFSQGSLLTLPLFALVAGLLAVSSRGSWLGLAGAFPLIFVLTRINMPLRTRVLASVLLLGVGLAVAGFFFTRARSSPAGAAPSSAQIRVSMYRSAALLWKDAPAFGKGLGTFSTAFAPYKEKMVEKTVDHLHCDWGEVIVETGLAGAIAMLFGLFIFLTQFISNAKNQHSTERRAVTLGAGTAVMVCALHALVEFGLHTPGNVVYLLAAIALAQGRIAGAPALEVGLPPWRKALPGLFAAVFLVLAVSGLRRALRDGRASGIPIRASLNRIVAGWGDPTSDYQFKTAFDLYARAHARTPADTRLLRAALEHTQAGLHFDPVNSRGNRLAALILTELGRYSDASLYSKRASGG